MIIVFATLAAAAVLGILGWYLEAPERSETRRRRKQSKIARSILREHVRAQSIKELNKMLNS